MAPFPDLDGPIDVSARADRVRHGWLGTDRYATMAALLVTDLTNIRWLTGFTGSAAMAVVLPDQVVLVTDGRYGDQAERQLGAAGCRSSIRIGRTAGEQTALLAEVVAGVDRLGFESAHTSHARWSQLTEALPMELVPTSGLVESCRRTKDAAEIR